jgi:2-oxoglutarate dehydrogenase E1 component
MDFRNIFQRDVVIDMYAYRRFGHNESDEPAFTQPIMYEAIKNRKSVREAYLERLLNLGEISREEADALEEARQASLEEEMAAARSKDYKLTYQAFQGIWDGYKGGAEKNVPEAVTHVDAKVLSDLLAKLSSVPESFTPNSKIKRLLSQRSEMVTGERPIDWAMGEALAFASLAIEGTHIRMTGQDIERGTFSHRHAVLHDALIDEKYTPLQHLSSEQAAVELYNSPLSESGVLGFEYGYSLDWPNGITLWEAQFGDFANAAQVIFDQFISSGEDKWRRLSALVMLLPHGFEGAGPEHSSARLERFLNLCAEDNMQIMNFTTPANYFHALRRQVVRKWRKPMIVMSPKSLLRHAGAVSELKELSEGRFKKVIHSKADPKKVRRILLCSGKVYYDLAQRREEENKRDEVAIVRLEQLYPIPEKELAEAIGLYQKDTPLIWVQEEPKNMGAWRFFRAEWCHEFEGHPFSGISRPESASPATGSGNSHKIEQGRLLDKAFNV